MKDQTTMGTHNTAALTGDKGVGQYLTFMLGKEIYGIPVSSVKEVIEFDRVFRIPKVPAYIRGVINLRGEVVPVVDLAFRFYGHPCVPGILSAIVFVEKEYKNKTILVGIMIDEVRAVADINHEKNETMPDFASKIRPDFIHDVGSLGDGFVMLLDVDRVIDIEELSNM